VWVIVVLVTALGLLFKATRDIIATAVVIVAITYITMKITNHFNIKWGWPAVVVATGLGLWYEPTRPTATLVIAVALFVYALLRTLALKGKFLTSLKQDRVSFVMVGGTGGTEGNVRKCLGNLTGQGKWVDPDTGEIHRTKRDTSGRIIAVTPVSELDPEKWETLIPGHPLYRKINRPVSFGRFLEDRFGWYWIGLNPDAHVWEGTFSRYQTDTGTGLDFKYVEGPTTFLYPSGVYGIIVTARTGGEIGRSEGMSVKLHFAVEIEVTNAKRAQFRIPANPFFITALKVGMESGVIGKVAHMDYDTLTRTQTEGAKSPWFKVGDELNRDQDGGNPSLMETNGVRVVAVHLQRVELSPEDERTMSALATAKRLANAQLEKNRGDRDTLDTVRAREQELAIELLKARRANDPTGVYAQAEALQHTRVTTLITGHNGGVMPIIGTPPTPPPAEPKKKTHDEDGGGTEDESGKPPGKPKGGKT
jgi:regulator of protease activity HflC (stomatin/prohibitin superfamily)